MALVWITVILLAAVFGFCLGRRWDEGEKEAEAEEGMAAAERGGVRLRTITVRR